MSLRFSLRQLEYLVAVGEAGSIVAAADRIAVSSPSISTAVSQLESGFGVQLFARQHGQGLTLTSGGRRLFDEARLILERAASLNGLANEIGERVRGPLALGALVTVAPYLSASLKRSFEAEHPEATLELREAHQPELLRMLGRAEVDAALTYDLDIPKDVDFDGVVELAPKVLLAAGHPAAHRDSIPLEALGDEPLVLLDLPASREYFLSMFHRAGLRPSIAGRSAELSVVLSLVANGYGYGLINLRTRTSLAPGGEPLVALELEGGHRPMVLGLATTRSEYRTCTVRAFAEHVRERARAGSLPGCGPGTPIESTRAPERPR